MNGKVSFGAALFGGALGSFVSGAFKAVLDALGMAPFEKAFELTIARSQEGQLPVNHDLDKALRTALAQATRVLAYHLHEPGRKSLGQLFQNFSDWPNLAHRLLEVSQNNILEGTPTDYWLANLIEQSKDPAKFNDVDLPLDLGLTDHSLTRLLQDQSDLTLKQAIHGWFLAWVNKHVPDNMGKPKDFAASVCDGWPVGKDGARLSFYDVVCVFFREQLKDSDKVFRAFTANVLAGLKGDLAEIRAARPDAAMLQRLTDTLAAFEEKEFDANYVRFQQHLKGQNDQVLNLLRQEFAAVHAHLERQEVSAERRHQEVQDRFAGLEALLRAQLQQPKPTNSPGPMLDFPRALREWADQHGITPEQARQEVDAWIAETRRTSTNLSERARAEFLAQRFTEAALLSAQAAAEKLARREQLAAEHRQLTEEAVVDLTRAGEALRAHLDFAGALARFEQALRLLIQTEQPMLWASLQVWLGIAHADLGIRVEGKPAQDHLRSAVTACHAALEVLGENEWPEHRAAAQNNLGNALLAQAERSVGANKLCQLAAAITAYRAALQTHTRLELPKDWAMTQNNLGEALRIQAECCVGDDNTRLLEEAVTAYHAALEVRNRVEMPQHWAQTQNNLGIALRAQAGRRSLEEKVDFLRRAVAAYHAALEVRTRMEMPQDWAATQNNLGNALRDLANCSDQAAAVRLLNEAGAAFREALTVYIRAELPQGWARTHYNLGIALSDQADRSAEDAAVRLQDEAVAAFRATLTVYTRAELPRDWARTQHNLGTALSHQAGRSEGADAVRLLGEAITAYRAALTAYTRAELPQDWAMTQNNLGNVLGAQAGRSEGAAVELLGEAVIAYREALTVFTREFHPRYYGIVSGNLAEAEATLVKLRGEIGPQ